MEDQDTSGSLEMRIMELENQLKELREAQQAMGGQAGAQAAMPCSYCYCGYCYCGYCYCYAAGGQQQAASPCIPCAPGTQAASPCIPCAPGAQAAVGPINPILICRICYCIVECICGPCNICTVCGFSGGGFSGGGGRFGGLGG